MYRLNELKCTTWRNRGKMKLSVWYNISFQYNEIVGFLFFLGVINYISSLLVFSEDMKVCLSSCTSSSPFTWNFTYKWIYYFVLSSPLLRIIRIIEILDNYISFCLIDLNNRWVCKLLRTSTTCRISHADANLNFHLCVLHWHATLSSHKHSL